MGPRFNWTTDSFGALKMAQQIEFEGTIHEFPDDFSPEEISAALAPPAGPLQPSANAVSGPEGYSGPSYGPNNPLPGLGRSARLAGEDTVSTANKILGTPVDLAAMVMNAPVHAANIPIKLFGGEGFQPPFQRPFGGSESLQGATNAAISTAVPGYEPIADQNKNFGENLVSNMTEFAGQGAAGGTGLARVAAGRLANPNTASRIGDTLLRTYAQRPGMAVAADTAAGAGSGAGVTVAQDAAPGNPYAEFLGGLAGAPLGLGGLRVAQGLAESIGSRIVNAIRGTGIPNDPTTPFVPVPNRVADKAANTLQGAASNREQALGNLGESSQFFQNENLPQPTAGLQSNDIGLIGLEQSARRANPKPYVESDARVQAGAADQVSQMRPDVPPSEMRLPQQMAQERARNLGAAGERRVQRTEDQINATQQAATANDQANQNLAAPVRAEQGAGVRAEASRQLDTQVSGALNERTAQKNAAFDALPASPVDTAPLRQRAARIAEQNNALRPDEQLPTQFVQQLQALEGNATLPQLADARKYLNVAGDRAQKTGNFDLANNIRGLRQEINAAIDAHPDAAAANAYYRQEYAPFFAEGRGKVYRDKVQRDANGRQDLPPERVAEFWLNDTEDSAAHLSRIMRIAPDPAAAQRAARQYLVSDLAKSATNPDGTMNPVALRQWLDNNRGKLASPELSPVYNEIEQLQRNVVNNRATGDALGAEVTRLNQRMRQIAQTNKEVERAIDNGALGTLIKNDPVNAAKEVIAQGGDPVARAAAMNKVLDRAPANIRQRVKDAWGAAVVDALQERIGTTRNAPGSETATLSYSALVKELDRNEEVLREVFRGDPDKMRAMTNARKALEVLSRRAQQATVGSQTAEAAQQSKQYSLMVEAGLKAYYGVLKGGGLNRTFNVLKRTILRDDSPDVARLLERAFTEDPRIMEQLLNRQVQGPKPGYNVKLNRAIGAKEAATDDEGDRRRANQR